MKLSGIFDSQHSIKKPDKDFLIKNRCLSLCKKNNKGFTLIEILVTLVAMTILFGVGAQILNTTMHSWNMVTLRKDMLYDSRLGMTRMLHDIRHADITKITTFDPAHFVFTDVNNNPCDFEQSGTNLLKNGNIMADSLKSANGLQFTYLDLNGNAASAATAIYRVRVRLDFQKGGQTLTVDSETRIRNL